MLYPKISIDLNARLNELPSGHIGLLPVALGAGQTITFVLQQVIINPQNLSQDRSLRVWFSDQPGGRSLTEATTITVQTLTALSATVMKLVANDVVGAEGGQIIQALPGQYWLNVLNLVNESNSFAIEQH